MDIYRHASDADGGSNTGAEYVTSIQKTTISLCIVDDDGNLVVQ